MPLLVPAGAYHGWATLSLNAYTPGIIVDAGTHTCCPELGSIVFNQGQYVAAYEVSKLSAFPVTVNIGEL